MNPIHFLNVELWVFYCLPMVTSVATLTSWFQLLWDLWPLTNLEYLDEDPHTLNEAALQKHVNAIRQLCAVGGIITKVIVANPQHGVMLAESLHHCANVLVSAPR